MKYLIVIEETTTGYSAYLPDVPGCVVTGRTRDDVEKEMRGAVAFHLSGLTEEGRELPDARATASYVEIDGIL